MSELDAAGIRREDLSLLGIDPAEIQQSVAAGEFLLADLAPIVQVEASQTRRRERKRRYRWYQYGITPELGAWLLGEQGGRCPIDGAPLTLETVDVDHDHGCCPVWSCGRCIRGLVCSPCNLLVEQVENDQAPSTPEVAAYLARGHVVFPPVEPHACVRSQLVPAAIARCVICGRRETSTERAAHAT